MPPAHKTHHLQAGCASVGRVGRPMIEGLAVQVLGCGSVLGQDAEVETAPNEPGKCCVAAAAHWRV